MSTIQAVTYVDELAEFVRTTRLEDISDAALRHMRIVFADMLAAFAAGNQQPEMKALLSTLLAEGAPGEASVIGAGQRVNPMDAAALNAAAGCWLELDEGNLAANGHPGIQVFPAALAVAQQRGSSGEEFLLACTLGYEVAGRIGSACDSRMSVHPHGTYGVVGAAIAVAKLRGLEPGLWGELINLAGASPIAGNRTTMKEGATLRNWYASHSAIMGQTAVRLIESGFTGPADGIGATCGDVLYDNFRPQQVVHDLGRHWLCAGGYIKFYGCGRPIHAAIDALRDALEKAGTGAGAGAGPRLAPEDIERIEVRAFKFAVFLGAKEIRNAFATRFSTPFAMATIIVNGSFGTECFDEKAASNPVILGLVQRVELTEVPEYSAEFPRKQMCDVTIVMKNGSRHSGHCVHMRGEPENPADPAEFKAKFRSLCEPIWGARLAEQVYDDAIHVERLGNMRQLAGGVQL